MIHTKGFVLSLDPFLDRGALLSLLTPGGVFFAFDAHFFSHSQHLLPHLKESFFEIRLAQGNDQNRFYLKKLLSLSTHPLSGEALLLWPLVQSFISLSQNFTERADLIFQSYSFLLQKLSIAQTPEDYQKIYFLLAYTFFHALDFLGQGPLIYHYQMAIESFLPPQAHQDFHTAFNAKALSKPQFQAVFLYLTQHWYTYFSTHPSLEICYQCWIASSLYESEQTWSKLNV